MARESRPFERNRCTRGGSRRLTGAGHGVLAAVALASALVLAVASSAAAEGVATSLPGPPIASMATTRADDAAAWRGRFCTPLGCAPRPAAPLTAAAGFGLAVFGAAWLGRRSDAEPDPRDALS